jgi:hypothetical protein
MKPEELWAELKRRRVVRVAVAYAAAVFVALQVADLTFEPLGLPEWSYRFLLLVAIAGFPLVTALAWAFDVTPEGVRRDSGGDGIAGSGTAQAGSSSSRVIILGVAAAVLVIGVGAWRLGGCPNVAAPGPEGVDDALIAVVPFRTASTDERVTILREGIIDMLSPIFSESPRIVDTGAMVSAWRAFVDDEEGALSEGQAVELAGRLGAGRVLVGSVVGGGEDFVVNARLLRVPGGDVIGDASVDGSADALRETVSQLAGQVLSMEAGVDRGQIDYLDDVPLAALEAYLEGRRAYRRSAYVEARTAFSRALDVDSTFALAALGAREAVHMGLDADRVNLSARANRLLRANLDRLPPRDRTYAELWMDASGRRQSVMEELSDREELVRRLPDKAEAWYLYGDWLLHQGWRVAEDGWIDRAPDAFRRAVELDPGLAVVQQHFILMPAFNGDTTGLRERLELDADVEVRSESSVLAEAALAFVFAEEEHRQWIDENLGRLSYAEAQMVALMTQWPVASVPAAYADRAFDRLESTAISAGDREQALVQRYSYLRTGGRAAEADDQLRLIESAFGPRPEEWLTAYLYWDGIREPAVAAANELAARIDIDEEPLDWNNRGQDACLLELWRLRDGNTSRVSGTVARLRAGADDPDPVHGRNALCALALETVAAHRTASADAERLLDELTRVLDEGPSSVLPWVSLEAAWLAEASGDLQTAARLAGYVSGSNPLPTAGSTIRREAGRLADAAGDAERAIAMYRWYLAGRPEVDGRFSESDEAIRIRLEELRAAR